MLAHYLKLAAKVLLRRKFFTFISLFAIAFTLLVLVVAVSMLDAIFGPAAPETKAERTLYAVGACMSGGMNRMTGFPGYLLLDKYERDLPNVEAMAIATVQATVPVYHDGERVDLYLKRTDGEFWRILDFEFLEGSPFTAEDEHSANRVAVINEATRARLFGGEPAVGRTFDVDGQTFRVVGVVANVPYLRAVPFSDVWVPLSTDRSDAYKRELVGNCMGLFLARDRSDFPAIESEYQSRLGGVEMTDPRNFDRIESTPGTLYDFVASQLFGNGAGGDDGSRAKLTTLLGAFALLFMLLPTVNLVNINVSRIMERSGEIGVRKAFGASSRALVGQFLVENVAVTVLGGAVALAAALGVLRAVAASGLFPYAQFGFNPRVFLYGLAVSLVFGVLSGVYPAWKMSRLDPVRALKGGAR